MNVSVIIPALNEEAALPQVLADIPKSVVRQIIVADNGSTDHTVAVAQQAGAVVVHEPFRGYGAACLAGIAALPKDTEVVAFLDADYSDFPEELPTLLEPLENNQADMVIGSRVLGGGEGLLPQQKFGNALACWLIGQLWGYRYTDLGPFRAIRKTSLDRLCMRDRTFGWTVEMQIKALKAGLRVVEVPVRYRKRIGQSKISGTLSGSLKAGATILWTIAKNKL